MGFLDSIEGLAGQQQDAGTNARVAGGVMQALEEHPGGLSGIMDQFKSNGMADHVQQWASGAQPTATPDQMQQGLAGSGFIESVAAKAGVSPQAAQTALATVLPLVLTHFTNGGQQAPPQNGFAGMATQLMGRFL